MIEQVSTFERLYAEHGPLVSGKALAKLAGFSTTDGLRMAHRRNTIGFTVFRIPARQGLFAHTADLARWLDRMKPAPTPEKGDVDMT